MKRIAAALLLAAGLNSAAAAQITAPLQFIGVDHGQQPRAWFIERTTERQGVKDLHRFWSVGVNGAKLPEDAEIVQTEFILPCNAETYVRWGTSYWRDGKILGGEGAGLGAPLPVQPNTTLAALRAVACGKANLTGPLLRDLAQVKQAAAAVPKAAP